MRRISLAIGITAVFSLVMFCTPDAKTDDKEKAAPENAKTQQEASLNQSSSDAGMAAAESAMEADTPAEGEGGAIAMAEPVKPTEPVMPDLPPDGSGKPIKGRVIDMIDYASGGSGIVNKEQALVSLQRGHPLGLLVGTGSRTAVFMIVEPSGVCPNKELAERANFPVGVVGRRSSKNGLHVIVAELIETMR